MYQLLACVLVLGAIDYSAGGAPSECKFPFEYKGDMIKECTTLNSNQEWCSLDSVYEGRWVYCKETIEDKFDKLLKKQLEADSKIKDLEDKAKSGGEPVCGCQKELSLVADNQIRTDRVIGDHERRLKSCDSAETTLNLLIQRITKLEVGFSKAKTVQKLPLQNGESCVPHGNRNYVFVTHNRNFNDAENYCRSRGGHLASPENQSENHWLGQTARGKRENVFWYIGANDIAREGHYVYLSGGSASGADWWRGEPNNAGNEDCIHYGLVKGGNFHKWNDIPCRHGAFFICEFSSGRFC